MEKQEIRTFGRRHGKKLSGRQQRLIDDVLPKLRPLKNNISEHVILEIGFGSGEHLRNLAENAPNKTIIGAEPFMNGVASLLSAITDINTDSVLPNYQNIRIYADDVRQFLRDTDSKFEQIWVLHPDPWPKARHEKRRLLQTDFIQLLYNHLTPGGEIIIGTDHWEYYDWITQEIEKAKLSYTSPDIDTIKTRYQEKNKAGTQHPKYLIIKN